MVTQTAAARAASEERRGAGRRFGLAPTRIVPDTVGSPVAKQPAQPSGLSRYLAMHLQAESPEMREDAALADVVDPALRSMHKSSQRHLPSAEVLLEGLPAAHREETLVWLLQAFDVMNFPDSLLFDTTLLLDRYYSTLPREDRPESAQQKLLAAVMTTLKTSYPTEMQLPLRKVVEHLGRDQLPFELVARAEHDLLRALKFHVGTPTSRDFLEGISLRLVGTMGGGAWRSLAEFLLQLTLADAPLHFKYAHSVLAVAVAILALWTTRAPVSAFEIVLEDFGVTVGDPLPLTGAITRCMADINGFWKQNVSGSRDQSLYARHLCVKFGRVSHHTVAGLAPPPTTPSHVLPVPAWTTTDQGLGTPGPGTPGQDRRFRRAASWCGKRTTRQLSIGSSRPLSTGGGCAPVRSEVAADLARGAGLVRQFAAAPSAGGMP